MHRRLQFWFSTLLALAAIAIAHTALADGTWAMAPANTAAGGQAFGLWLLSDGRVLSHGGALNQFVILTPDVKGSYEHGSWSPAASKQHARGGAQQHVLKDGRFFEAGGEYVDGPACTPALCASGEIYDPVADKWTDITPAPHDIGDTGSAMLDDGRILDSTRKGNQIQIYDPATDKWTDGKSMPLNNGQENAWAALQNGGVLAVGYARDGAAIYDSASGTWQRTGAVPSGFDVGDAGGISLMFDGRVFVYGLGKSYIYTPGPTGADPGTWDFGPDLLNGNRAEDEFTDTLPNGQVWGALVQMTYGPGVVLQEFDPMTNTSKSVTPPPDTGNPYPIGYVNLPNGQVMVTAERNDWIYTPDTQPQDEWRPVVTSVDFNSDGTYTLKGTQLTGLINGADEGDDMTMAENFPVVWLTDETGDVHYCRSFNFSHMMPHKAPLEESCQFTTPADLPAGTYDLYVSAVGVISKDPVLFTTGMGGKPTGGGSGGSGGSGAAGSGSGGAGAGTGTGGTSGQADAGSATGATGVGGAGGSSGSSGGGVPNNGTGVTSGAAGADSANGATSAGAGAGAKSGGCGCDVPGASSRSAPRASLTLLLATAWLFTRRRRA